MPMSFASVLRGRIAERILVSLLERGGFRVTRLGIEELFDEVKFLPLAQYLALGLPPALRSLPDLLVADPSVSWAGLIEVKFRSRFTRAVASELHETLTEQRKYWPESHAILMIGQPFDKDDRFHQDYIRVIPPNGTDRLLYKPADDSSFDEFCKPPEGPPRDEREEMKLVWQHLPMITSIFYRRFGDSEEETKRAREFWSGADYVTAAVRELGKI